MQLVVKKQHPGINREHCCDDLHRSTKVEEEVSYVVRISGCSVNVPATVNPKVLFLSSPFDSLYEFLVWH